MRFNITSGRDSIAGDRREHLAMFGVMIALTAGFVFQLGVYYLLPAATAFIAGHALNNYISHPYLSEIDSERGGKSET